MQDSAYRESVNRYIMKSVLFFLLFINFSLHAQPFVLSLNHEPLNYNNITDAVQIGENYYFLQIRVGNFSYPFHHDCYTDLVIADENGIITNIINLAGYKTEYHRILKVIDDDIYLVGYLKSDSCESTLVISKFNLPSQKLDHLSSYELCDHTGLSIILRNGLSDNLFIEEYHSAGMNTGARKHIFSIDSNYVMNPVIEDIHTIEIFSVDFSRKGYLISTLYLYNFYDSDFNLRKKKSSPGTNFYSLRETHKPFGKNYILEQSVQDNRGADEYGMHVRLVDSNLVVKKKVTILPGTPFNREMDMPFLGGIDIKNENEIWAAGTYGYSPIIDSTFYTITKLDSNLNIICQHFIGGDTWYFLWGIRALDSGGAIVYGSRVEKGDNRIYGNGYALRIGENCELPATVSTNSPIEPVFSVSAYPNPGLNDLTFSVNGYEPASLRVELINESGQVLYSKKDLTNSIQVPDLPAGQYYYRILNGERLLGIGAWVKAN